MLIFILIENSIVMSFHRLIILFVSFSILIACGTNETVVRNKTPDKKNEEKGTYMISVPIVEKPIFIKGEVQERTDLYIERSIQDYFIKFCESKVTRKEVEKALSTQTSFIKTLEIEIDYKEGEWDNCQENKEEKVVSRTGQYVIIHKIIR